MILLTKPTTVPIAILTAELTGLRFTTSRRKTAINGPTTTPNGSQKKQTTPSGAAIIVPLEPPSFFAAIPLENQSKQNIKATNVTIVNQNHHDNGSLSIRKW